jgi:competence protein ComEA
MEAVYLNGDFIMINSYWIQANTRAAMAARNMFWIDFWGVIVASFFILALVVALLTGSPPVLAQEQSLKGSPAVTSVNINTDGAQALAANLKGVGESRAMEIVRYRESYGPFESVDELADVKGIGKSTLDMNRSVITLE